MVNRPFSVMFCAAFFASACSGGDSPPFADISWLVSCPPALTGCFVPEPVHVIRNLDGENGHVVRCAVTELSDRSRKIRFRAFDGTDGIEVDNLVIPEAGGGPVPGSGCRIRVDDNDVSYGALEVGTCGAAAPSPDSPCQIQSVSIAMGELVGQILCKELPAPAAPTVLIRDITSPDGPMPFPFRFLNCDGL